MRPVATRVVSLLLVMALPSVSWSWPTADAVPRPSPVGVIAQAARKNRAIDPRTEGTTVYEGDILPLDGDSYALVEIGKSRISLKPLPEEEVDPQVVFRRLASGFSVHLLNGTVDISTDQGETFEVFADGIKIEPVREEAVTVEITRPHDTELDLISQKGALRISMHEQVKTIEEGHSYRLELLPEGSSDLASSDSQPQHPGKSWFTITMLAAISIGTAIVVWRALISPCRP